MISTGTARKNSTMVPHTQRSALDEDNRPIPSSKPRANAITIDRAAAVSVPSMPGRM